MNISIFAKPYFIGQEEEVTTGPYLHRGTSYIRGEQVADYLGGKYNPTSGFEDDICIYLKPRNLDQIRDADWVDFSDGEPYLIKLLLGRPKIKVIASSQTSFKFLKDYLRNEIVFIPEHHCNFERIKRTRTKVITGGIITNPSTISYQAAEEMTRQLSKIGLELLTCFDWKTRSDVVDFYQKVDFQIVPMFGMYNDYDPFRHPTKMINAASYGIPSIATWKAGFKEFEGFYIPVFDMKELVTEVEKLKDPDYYQQLSQKIIPPTEPYHIENVAKLYRNLK